MSSRTAWLGATFLFVTGCSDLFGFKSLSAAADASAVGAPDGRAPSADDASTNAGDGLPVADSGDATAPCPTCGGATCVDLSTNPSNCGACGTVCAAAQVCRSDKCVCRGSTTLCGTGPAQTCADLLVDPQNCGACGVSCPATQSCQQGRCVCPGSTTACANGCVLTGSDRTNCGGCGVTCGVGANCSGGACFCPGNEMLCTSASSAACIDATSDHDNCGGCHNDCGTDATCEVSAVAPFAPSCVLCTAIQGSLHCGNAQTCVDPTKDVHNCGQCGNACPPTQICSGSQCVCPTGEKSCPTATSSVCVSVASDPLNCGACGNACSGGMACQSGKCVCPASQHDCGGICYPDNSRYPSRCGMQCTPCAIPDNGLATCGGTPPACGESCRANFTLCGAGTADAACMSSTGDASSCGD